MLYCVENIALQSLQIFSLLIVLRAEIVTTLGSKMVTICARNTIRKFANFERLYSFHIFNISPPNFGILLLLKGSFREFLF